MKIRWTTADDTFSSFLSSLKIIFYCKLKCKLDIREILALHCYVFVGTVGMSFGNVDKERWELMWNVFADIMYA